MELAPRSDPDVSKASASSTPRGGVGRSWRTYAKHELMRSFVGKEVGAVNAMARRERMRCAWFDLTAGDGVAVDGEPWTASTSPGLLARHATNLGVPFSIDLYEIKPAHYDRLLSNLSANLPALGYLQDGPGRWTYGRMSELTAVCGSGADADLSTVGRDDAVLVLNDPNAITQWAMRPTFAQELEDRTWLFRSLSTMGCNASGVKMLPRLEREQWFDLVGQLEQALPRYRDLLLTAIERDDAQWAYLLGESEKWRTSAESVVRTAFNRVGRTTESAWYRLDPEGFEAAKKRLFLTKRERRTEEGGLW